MKLTPAATTHLLPQHTCCHNSPVTFQCRTSGNGLMSQAWVQKKSVFLYSESAWHKYAASPATYPATRIICFQEIVTHETHQQTVSVIASHNYWETDSCIARKYINSVLSLTVYCSRATALNPETDGCSSPSQPITEFFLTRNGSITRRY